MKYGLIYIDPDTNKVDQVFLSKKDQRMLETMVENGYFGYKLSVNEEPIGEIESIKDNN